MTKYLYTALLAWSLAPGAAFAQSQQTTDVSALPPTHRITIVDTIQTGENSQAVVLGTVVQDQGSRLGAYLDCQGTTPRITFQFSFYPADRPVRLWVAAPGQPRVSYGRLEQGGPQTGYYAPTLQGDTARKVSRDLLQNGAQFGDSATIRLQMPAEDYATHMAKLPCF